MKPCPPDPTHTPSVSFLLLSLKREEHYRTISSTQRRGRPLEDSVLRLNEDTGLVELTGTKKAMDTALKGEEILAFLEEQEEPVRMATIQAALRSQRKPLNDTLRALVEQGKIGCEGSGKRGDPYRYCAVFPRVPKTRQFRQHAGNSNCPAIPKG